MPEQSSLFIISVFPPVSKTSSDFLDYPVFTQTRVTETFYRVYDTSLVMLNKYLSVGVVVKVGITETDTEKPRYIVYYAEKKTNGRIHIYKRKTDYSPLEPLEGRAIKDHFKRSNALAFTKEVKPVKEKTPMLNVNPVRAARKLLSNRV